MANTHNGHYLAMMRNVEANEVFWRTLQQKPPSHLHLTDKKNEIHY